KLALPDKEAILVLLPEQVTLNFGRDVGVHRPIVLRHILLHIRHVLLGDFAKQHLGRLRRGLLFFLFAGRQPQQAQRANHNTNRSPEFWGHDEFLGMSFFRDRQRRTHSGQSGSTHGVGARRDFRFDSPRLRQRTTTREIPSRRRAWVLRHSCTCWSVRADPGTAPNAPNQRQRASGSEVGCSRRNSTNDSLGTWTCLPLPAAETTVPVAAPAPSPIAAPFPPPARPPMSAPSPAPPATFPAVLLPLP